MCDILCSAQLPHVRRLHRNLADRTKQSTETVVVTFHQQVLLLDCFFFIFITVQYQHTYPRFNNVLKAVIATGTFSEIVEGLL